MTKKTILSCILLSGAIFSMSAYSNSPPSDCVTGSDANVVWSTQATDPKTGNVYYCELSNNGGYAVNVNGAVQSAWMISTSYDSTFASTCPNGGAMWQPNESGGGATIYGVGCLPTNFSYENTN